VVRRGCPYHWCASVVEVSEVIPPGVNRNGGLPFDAVDGGPDRGIIRMHDIKNEFLQGPCPASLMYFPFDIKTYTYLMETRYNQDLARINTERIAQELHGEGSGSRSGSSQSLRQPGRMGREPGLDSPDWVLGGRADEDVVPVEEEVHPPISEGVSGHSMGGTGMASLTELAAMINGAGVAGNEAYASVELAKNNIQAANIALLGAMERLDDAVRTYAGVLAESGSSGRVAAALGATQRARNACEAVQATLQGQLHSCDEAQSAINDAGEQGNAFVANLFS
jgi:hypothetical protein